MWHPDPDCNQALTRLMDALCQWERTTGRESLLIFVPVANEEEVVIADSGKPLGPGAFAGNRNICDRLERALEAHDDPNAHTMI